MTGKKATREQRKQLEANGLSSHDWLVAQDTSTYMVVVHRITGIKKTINKY